MSALQKALEEFRARQASVAATQVKDATNKAWSLGHLVTEAMRWNFAERTSLHARKAASLQSRRYAC